MMQWVAEYWYICALALALGLATAAWIWLPRAAADDVPLRDIDEPAPSAPLEPVKPVIEAVERIDFSAFPAAPVPAARADAASSVDRPAIAAATGAPDDLMLIKGVGPKLNALLTALGVTRFDQIAAWNAADIAEVDRFLGVFTGRITRDAWVEQAGFLARGDMAGFTARFGALGGERAGR